MKPPFIFRSFFLALTVAFMASCSPKVIHKLSWQPVPVVVDGSLDENARLPFTLSDKSMFYQVSNDRTHLYVSMRIVDEQLQFQALRGGVELWIDTTSKTPKSTVIKYPLPIRFERPKPASTPQEKPEAPTELTLAQRPSNAALKQQMLEGQNSVHLRGFRVFDNGAYPIDNNTGIEVAVDVDEKNTLIYEASIPFRAFYRDRLQASDTAKVFTIEIKILAPDMPRVNNDPYRHDPFNDGRYRDPRRRYYDDMYMDRSRPVSGPPQPRSLKIPHRFRPRFVE